MIVATAGHIDHGKTALVRALTGIDADRLPEEQRRGMTIDLGFAYMPVENGPVVGFVDVPGHERFVRNMLAGVAGIDLALLIVAADDGPMPQTREHLAILDLLGVPGGVIALTKTDRVPDERVAAVAEDIAALVAGTPLESAPLFRTSAVSGAGIDQLRRHLSGAARRLERPAASGRFRLAIDRAFTLKGAGLVVTGTVFAGSVKVGDRLVLSPSGIEARVRGIHAQSRESHFGHAGQRCAVNIVGPALDRRGVRRGDWLVDPAAHAPTSRFDVRLRALPGEGDGFRDRMPVHVHLGAADVTGRLTLLDGRAIAPGDAGWARLTLDHPVGAIWGDRFVLRDQSARATVGGGRVVDPWPPARGARRPARLAALAALDTADPAKALAALLEQAEEGVDLAAFFRARNLDPAEAAGVERRVGPVRSGGGDQAPALTPTRVEALETAMLAALEAWHRDFPDRPGAPLDLLRSRLTVRAGRVLAAGVVERLAARGAVQREAGMLRLPDHRAALSEREAALWAKVEPLLAAGGIRPPRVRELAEALATDHREIEALLRRATRMGLVADVASNRFFPPEALAELKALAETLAAEASDGRFTAQQFKDRSGIGRNVTIELLEYLDRTGFTRREGEARRIARRPAGAS